MANSTVAAANKVDQWCDKYFKEYVRDSRFKRYMGADMNKPVQMIEDLTKKRGDDVTISLVTRLSGNGITGDNTLDGNEEALGNYGHKLTVDQLRNAVTIGNMEQQKSKIDFLEAARPMLKLWSMEKLRDEIIAALYSANVDGSTAYGSCSEAQKDAWLAANSDRVLFGAVVSNNASNDHSAALANCDTTADILSPTIVSLSKRRALQADPHIRPIRVGEDEEWFVMFVSSLAFRDLKNNSTMVAANREGWTRGKSNPLFSDGDLIWDGVIIREVPEITAISSVGASSADVTPCFLCGAQAVGVAWAERPKAIFKTETDYGNLKGVGISEIRAVDKLMYNSIQHGLHTTYVATAADT